MDRKRLQELAKNPNNIPGVYNYCDRWCERCIFTSRCLNYASSEEQFPDDASRDINNAAFWEKLSECFKLTFEMVAEDAKRFGIDLSEIKVTDKDLEEIEREEEMLHKHPCAVESNKYINLARKWFEEREVAFQQKEEELNAKLSMGLESENIHEEANEIKDAIEVIQWYLFFIHVKIMRALHSKKDEKDDDDDYPKDSDGSAKIALIATDRSMAAWSILLKYLPEEEDFIISMLALLDKVRRMTEKEFPGARAFVRAGWDE